MSRIGRLDELSSVVLDSSRKSFINTVCKFVKEVDEMNATVLVPSKLNDVESNDVPECQDLHTLHKLLNRLRDELTSARFDEDSSNSNSRSSSTRQQHEQEIMLGMSKKITSSCKCTDSDDGFSSLTSFSRNSDDDESDESDSEYGSNNRDNGDSKSSSPEYIVNLLRLHVQGIQSILTRFSKYADQVSESYISSIN